VKEESSVYSGFIWLCYWSGLNVLIWITSLCCCDDRFLLRRSDVTNLVLLMSLSTMRHAHHIEPALNRIRMNQMTGYTAGSYFSIWSAPCSSTHLEPHCLGPSLSIATALFRMRVDLDHTDPRIADSNPAGGINLGCVRFLTVLGFPEVLSISWCLLCLRGPTKIYETFITSESLTGERKLLKTENKA